MWIDDQMDDILAEASTLLAACGTGEELCWVAKVPGEIVTDTVCEEGACGQLTLRITDVFPGDDFPNAADPSVGNCHKPLVYGLELRAMRCYEDTAENGEGPTPDEASEALVQQNADMMAMYQAIKCGTSGRRTAIQQYRPEGPGGNYVGGAWTFWIAEDY